ncbi:hypothetical protein ACFHW2_05190 [Actinomadura sp. LOL_016]|uniref:hypothetical protein n=1 Tax=unclassified Actinomadura TaxID=2626254 RepID=UPI0019A3F81C|nr:hypothetical protein GCM10010182_22180 [Actinomadura cremea]
MPPQEPTRRLRSRAVKVGMVSALSVTLVACGSKSTVARCVDREDPGGRKVVSDFNCDRDDIDDGASYGQYYWYYGGSVRNGYASGGSSVRPEGKIKSRNGTTLSRGGFGGRGGGGGS